MLDCSAWRWRRAISVSIAPPAEADTILTYTGNNFNSVSGIYSTTDHLTASLVLSAPLGANLTDYGVTPVSWTFNDGIHALSSSLFRRITQPKYFLYGFIRFTYRLEYTSHTGLTCNNNRESHRPVGPPSGQYSIDYSGPSISFGDRTNAPGVWAVSTSHNPFTGILAVVRGWSWRPGLPQHRDQAEKCHVSRDLIVLGDGSTD